MSSSNKSMNSYDYPFYRKETEARAGQATWGSVPQSISSGGKIWAQSQSLAPESSYVAALLDHNSNCPELRITHQKLLRTTCPPLSSQAVYHWPANTEANCHSTRRLAPVGAASCREDTSCTTPTPHKDTRLVVKPAPALFSILETVKFLLFCCLG